MNILVLSYGIIDYDGRLKELINVAENMGKVTTVCCAENRKSDESSILINTKRKKYLGLRLYSEFFLKSLLTMLNLKNIDILIVDNYFAANVGLIIKKFFKIKYVVQDVRELYFINNMNSWRGKLLVKSEVSLMKQADVVLTANEARSKIMTEYYKLEKNPIVFENIRFLEGSYNKKELDEKYKNFFKYKYNIISSGGISVARGTDRLVNAMSGMSKDYGLYIVGGGTIKDISIIKELINKLKLTNVHLIAKVPLQELKYIVNNCDIGIVNYHKKDLNNEYCASGKIYEYIGENLPIVTTDNIPLKNFCEEYEVGVADNNFKEGLLKVSKNINYYKYKVEELLKKTSVNEYNLEVAEEILSSIQLESKIHERSTK
ncbi:hypothetical protein [Salinicoccus halodurans]|uniref:Glycosyltransferase involved in cell wall bisynthesis n=1 Tax=Salinicoccus halodurans TaxID=407035 RepID=A0A0F7HK66_9STAP|nr:hypothetical protein [Salinicoccus halodurans]AKG73462.1 hypothetical protein AAT16_04075 [Salinicoccus halodurans]SFK50955.1 Glycosyltransferase involved in cell wall bisynthesis [Salinicoccus halodurans]